MPPFLSLCCSLQFQSLFISNKEEDRGWSDAKRIRWWEIDLRVFLCVCPIDWRTLSELWIDDPFDYLSHRHWPRREKNRAFVHFLHYFYMKSRPGNQYFRP